MVSNSHSLGRQVTGLIKKKVVSHCSGRLLQRLSFRGCRLADVNPLMDKGQPIGFRQRSDKDSIRCGIRPQPMIEVGHRQRIIKLKKAMKQGQTVRSAGNTHQDQPVRIQIAGLAAGLG
jgi:hypothetical protein